MSLSHKQKIKLARQIRTPEELRKGVPIFQTIGWFFRNKAIKMRLVKQKTFAESLENL